MEPIFKLEDKPGFRAIGRRRRFDRPREDSRAETQAFFAEAKAEGLFAQIAPLGAVEPLGILSIYDSRSTGPNRGFDLWIAVASEAETPDDLEAIDIPAASYLTFSAVGSFPDVLIELEDSAIEQLRLSPSLHSDSLDIEIHPFALGEGGMGACALWISIAR